MQTGLIICLFVAILAIWFFILSWLMRQDRVSALCFTILAGTLGVYTAGVNIRVMGDSADAIVMALMVEGVGLSLLGPFFLLAVFSLYRPGLFAFWMPVSAVLYGFLFFVLIMTDGSHALYFTHATAVQGGAGWTVSREYGPLGIFQQAVNLIALGMAIVLAARAYVTGDSAQKARMRRPWIGLAIVLAAMLIELFAGLKPEGILMIFASCIGIACFTAGSSRGGAKDGITEITYAAIESMEDGMVLLDNDWRYQFSNRSAKMLFPGLWDCRPLEDVTRKPDWPRGLGRRTKPGAITFNQKDNVGMQQYYRASVQTVENQAGSRIGWSVVIRNVTDVTVMINQMEVLATTDPLTGIYNRRSFFEHVRQEMDRAKRHPMDMSLILYDLDYFKAINDTYGHSVGDMVLCSVVEAVKNQLRPYDIFARYGGEEFIIFATSHEELDLCQFTDRIRKAIEDINVVHNNKKIQITASFGAVKVSCNESIDRAFASVDNALYKAKTEGRNRAVICEPSGK